MSTRDPAKRRKIRALEAKRDTHMVRRQVSAIELKKIRAELKGLRSAK